MERITGEIFYWGNNIRVTGLNYNTTTFKWDYLKLINSFAFGQTSQFEIVIKTVTKMSRYADAPIYVQKLIFVEEYLYDLYKQTRSEKYKLQNVLIRPVMKDICRKWKEGSSHEQCKEYLDKCIRKLIANTIKYRLRSRVDELRGEESKLQATKAVMLLLVRIRDEN